MSKNPTAMEVLGREYPYGFVTEIEEDSVSAGLSEDVICMISKKKNEPEWLLDWSDWVVHSDVDTNRPPDN